jgi:hypothetical protein
MDGVIDHNGALTDTAHRRVIDALVREGLLDSSVDPRMPRRPYRMATGKERVSLVCCYFLPERPGALSGRNLVVKFDAPHRAAKEWAVKAELDRINMPAEILRPINQPQDELILYQAAEGLSRSGRCTDLGEDLVGRLLHDPERALRSLDRIMSVLCAFYREQPGKRSTTPRGATWGEEFPKLRDDAVVQQIAANLEPLAFATGPNQPRAWILPPGSGIRPLPNPLLDYPRRLTEPTLGCWLSRVHGDLNFGNMLIAGDDEVFVVDLAQSRTDAVTLTDAARMEVEFWLEVYPEVARQARWSFARMLQARVRLAGLLDRGAGGIWSVGPAEAAWQWVGRLRHHAARTVASHQSGDLFQREYHTALYFTFLRALAYASVWNPAFGGSRQRLQLAAVGTGLSLAALQRPSAKRRRRMASLSAAGAVGGVAVSVMVFGQHALSPIRGVGKRPRYEVYVFREPATHLPLQVTIDRHAVVLDGRGQTLTLEEGEHVIGHAGGHRSFHVPTERMIRVPSLASPWTVHPDSAAKK